MIKFYDTCALLQLGEKAFGEKFIISSITLEELEHIKTSAHKDNDTKLAARDVTRRLASNGNYKVIQYKKRYSWNLAWHGHEITNDMKILACAIHYKDCEFVTADISLYMIAKNWFKNTIWLRDYPAKPEYKGYTELMLSEEKIAELYMPNPENTYNLLTNEYVIIKSEDGKIIDLLCWDGNGYRHIDDSPIRSKFFGKISALKGDIYQKFAIDSLRAHQLTMLRGPAGCAKSFLSLIYFYSLLEKGEITRLYIFANPVATRNAAQLGYYSGSRTEKLMDSQTGNFLISKFGDPFVVQDLIDKGKIMLLPFADIRGISVPSGCAMYITEAQNTDIDLMKLALQRAEEGVKVVVEGDYETQVDMLSYEGKNNGLRRLSEIFRGQPCYSEVKLENNYRSEISKIAEKM